MLKRKVNSFEELIKESQNYREILQAFKKKQNNFILKLKTYNLIETEILVENVLRSFEELAKIQLPIRSKTKSQLAGFKSRLVELDDWIEKCSSEYLDVLADSKRRGFLEKAAKGVGFDKKYWTDRRKAELMLDALLKALILDGIEQGHLWPGKDFSDGDPTSSWSSI